MVLSLGDVGYYDRSTDTQQDGKKGKRKRKYYHPTPPFLPLVLPLGADPSPVPSSSGTQSSTHERRYVERGSSVLGLPKRLRASSQFTADYMDFMDRLVDYYDLDGWDSFDNSMGGPSSLMSAVAPQLGSDAGISDFPPNEYLPQVEETNVPNRFPQPTRRRAVTVSFGSPNPASQTTRRRTAAVSYVTPLGEGGPGALPSVTRHDAQFSGISEGGAIPSLVMPVLHVPVKGNTQDVPSSVTGRASLPSDPEAKQPTGEQSTAGEQYTSRERYTTKEQSTVREQSTVGEQSTQDVGTTLFKPTQFSDFGQNNYDLNSTDTVNGASDNSMGYDPFMSSVSQGLQPSQYNPYAEEHNPLAGAGASYYGTQNTYSTPSQPVSSALKVIHKAKLAARCIDVSKVILTDKNRIRLSACSIFDVIHFEAHRRVEELQQQDFFDLGKLVLSIGTNTPPRNMQDLRAHLEQLGRNYSEELKERVAWLLTQSQYKTAEQLIRDLALHMDDVFVSSSNAYDEAINHLGRELENGRLVRLLAKLGTINERPEFDGDPNWSETEHRYTLKLFRDYVFHQVDTQGNPVLDLGHIISCLNKLDAGTEEKIYLTSRDHQSTFLVTYRELKKQVQAAFGDLQKGNKQQQTNRGF
ncbi:hypothetical protein GQX73_g3054 [Xylaria multiplex]|uniref:Pan3 C-terminal knob domain-containing protein n=1 Tax=Xylaria multiplex TaxID=323545 RepID=A0A7C8NAC6_9PEZI|nr:hypothetical protein GQX73_g3054 [Xylaria multiplex]